MTGYFSSSVKPAAELEVTRRCKEKTMRHMCIRDPPGVNAQPARLTIQRMMGIVLLPEGFILTYEWPTGYRPPQASADRPSTTAWLQEHCCRRDR
jgi:hypothetical protein